jgi:hypothetical protein
MERQSLDFHNPFSWEASIIEFFSNAGYALARFAPPLGGGHTWQQWAYKLMNAAGAHQVQGPGSLHLFGYPSASGLKHELDAAGILDVAIVIEAKDQTCGVDKNEVDCFDGKTFDYYESLVRHGKTIPLYRILWSTSVIDPLIRRYAIRRGIIPVTPDIVPIPTLLAAASRWDAADWFTDQSLSELVLLGERSCRPLQGISCSGKTIYQYPFDLWRLADFEDFEYLQGAASSQWLNWLDKNDPLHFENIARSCLKSISGWSEVRACA